MGLTVHSALAYTTGLGYHPTCDFQKLELLAYIFVTDSMGLSSFKIFWLARKIHIFSLRVVSAVHDQPRSLLFVCDFLLVHNSNLGSILPRFRDIAGLFSETDPRPYSTLI